MSLTHLVQRKIFLIPDSVFSVPVLQARSSDTRCLNITYFMSGFPRVQNQFLGRGRHFWSNSQTAHNFTDNSSNKVNQNPQHSSSSGLIFENDQKSPGKVKKLEEKFEKMEDQIEDLIACQNKTKIILELLQDGK